MNSLKWFTTASVAAMALSLTAPAMAEVTMDDILNDAKTPGDVVTNGMGTQGQRYSGLKTVNTENVGALVPIWTM